MSYIKAVQTIADNQTEVASKLQILLDAEGVDSTEVKAVNVEPFGAVKFLILVLYAMLREVRALTGKVGLTSSLIISKRTYIRSLSTKTGLKSSFREVTTDIGNGLTGLAGMLSAMYYKLSTKISTTFGLNASSPIIKFAGIKYGTALIGTSLVWEAYWNGVEIELNP